MKHPSQTALVEITEAELADVVGGDAESDRALMEFLDRCRRYLEEQQQFMTSEPLF